MTQTEQNDDARLMQTEQKRTMREGTPLLPRAERRRSRRWPGVVCLLGSVVLVIHEGRELRPLVATTAMMTPATPSEEVYHRRLEKYVLNETNMTTCNDGSPGVYYFGAAEKGREDVWLVYLRGGGWCSTLEHCRERDTMKVSSTMTPAYLDAPLGSLWNDLPSSPLAGANVVYIYYCSSDAYLGSRPASNRTGGLAFRGRDILDATIEKVLTVHGLGAKLEETTQFLVFAGSSAGGRGVAYNLNRLTRYLKTKGNLKTAAILDSALWIDAPQVDRNVEEFLGLVQPKIDDIGCGDTFALEPWKCLITAHTLEYVDEIPVALFNLQYDRAGIAEIFFGDELADAAWDESLDAIRHNHRLLEGAALYQKELRAVEDRIGSRKLPTLIFSPACWGHDVFHENDLLEPTPYFDGLAFYMNHTEPFFLGPEYRLRSFVGNASFGDALDTFLHQSFDDDDGLSPSGGDHNNSFFIEPCHIFHCGRRCLYVP